MELWVGPAIVAALVSGLISAAGWFVTSWQTVVLERRRRCEKVRDFQIALRAEIRSDVLAMAVFDRATLLRQIAMYSDYLDTLTRLEALARRAEQGLTLSLGLSNPDEALWTPPSAGGPEGSAAAWAGGQHA